MTTKQEAILFNSKTITIPFCRVGVPAYTDDELIDLIKFQGVSVPTKHIGPAAVG
jgi:hypothetical protein